MLIFPPVPKDHPLIITLPLTPTNFLPQPKFIGLDGYIFSDKYHIFKSFTTDTVRPKIQPHQK